MSLGITRKWKECRTCGVTTWRSRIDPTNFGCGYGCGIFGKIRRRFG